MITTVGMALMNLRTAGHWNVRKLISNVIELADASLRLGCVMVIMTVEIKTTLMK